MNEKDDFVLEAILKATPYHDKDSIFSVFWSVKIRAGFSAGNNK